MGIKPCPHPLTNKHNHSIMLIHRIMLCNCRSISHRIRFGVQSIGEHYITVIYDIIWGEYSDIFFNHFYLSLTILIFIHSIFHMSRTFYPPNIHIHIKFKKRGKRNEIHNKRNKHELIPRQRL